MRKILFFVCAFYVFFLVKKDDLKKKQSVKTTQEKPFLQLSDPIEIKNAPTPTPVPPITFQEDFKKIEDLFLTQVPKSLDGGQFQTMLMELNSRPFIFVEKIFDSLKIYPVEDETVSARIAQVDYLKYRMAWDERVMELSREFIETPIESEISDQKSEAIILADKSEILGGMARSHWFIAEEILIKMPDSLLKKICLEEAYWGLRQSGIDEKEAKIRIDHIKREENHT